MQVGRNRLGQGLRLQAAEHVDDVLGAHPPRWRRTLQGQLHRHQHGVQPLLGHLGQYLRHHPVAPLLVQQAFAHALQWLGQVCKGRAVAQRARLALDQRHVMLPVVAGLVAIAQALVRGHHSIAGHHHDLRRVQVCADHLPRPFAGHRVAVARHRHQAGAAHLGRVLNIAIKGHRHRHQVALLQLQHLGDAERFVLRVAQLSPQSPAALAQPRIELGKAAKAPLPRLHPDATAAVLHILLHAPLLPAAGTVAKIRVEQIVRAHGCKARIDHAAFALLDFVDRRLHVVVDATACHATQRCKAAGVRIEQHLVALAGVGHQPEGPTGTQLHVRDLHAVVHPAHQQAVFAPVELEGLAKLEGQWHEGLAGRLLAFTLAPLADEVRHPRVATFVARCLDLREQGLGRAPLLLGPLGIGLQGLLELRLVRRQLGRLRRLPAVLGLDRLRLVQPLGHRVARQARGPRYLPLRLLVPAVHPPYLANHVHGDHPLHSLAAQNSRVGKTPGSVLGRHHTKKWLSFRSASTP